MQGADRVLLIVLQYTLFVIVRPEEVFNTTPPPVRSNFSCRGRTPGFYADVEANCKVYHTCDDYGNKFSYRCPEETAFRQDALICDHAHLVNCQATTYANVQDDVGKRDGSAFNARFESTEDDRSFSRTFQVIQQPTKTTSKAQPGFVFSSSVFLRDLNDSSSKKLNNRADESARSPKTNFDLCNANRERQNFRNDLSSAPSTVRPVYDRFESRQKVSFAESSESRDERTSALRRNSSGRTNGPYRSFDPAGRKGSTRPDVSFGNEPLRSFDPASRKGSTRPDVSFENGRKDRPSSDQTTKSPARDFLNLSFNNNRDYPYLETLRSIQANARSTKTATISTTSRTPLTTTEIPVHALTLSLKPLVPNELEYDPYYPKLPTSTEAYYTPSYGGGEKSQFRTSTQQPWSSVRFEIPAVLPDLNTLEDLVDRRKLFYIPRIRFE